jgi:transcriptional regulator with XRE-family HTH domain
MPIPKDDPVTKALRADIGRRLRALREEIEMTQAAIAAEIDANQEEYNRWENGARFPNPVKMILLCIHFRVDFNYIYQGTFRGLHQDLEGALKARLGLK